MFGAWRILMLDETQEASPKALEAMNKTLEEPPPWGVFIIVTRTIDRLPPTTISRCAIYELRPISFEMGLLHLKKLCELENIRYELEGLSLLAEVSRGEVRDMMTRLEQVSEGGELSRKEMCAGSLTSTMVTRSLSTSEPYSRAIFSDRLVLLRNGMTTRRKKQN